MSSNWPPPRERRTPQEAQAERDRQWREEIAERERQLQANRAIAQQIQQELINAEPSTSDDRSDLDNIAYNLHNAYDWQGSGDQCVTAVVRLHNNTYRVFPQRYMKAMGDYGNQHYANLNLVFMPGSHTSYHHLHAEMYAMLYYLINEQTPSEMVAEIGVSKPICPNCKHVLDYLGIAYNARWVTTATSPDWKNPWRFLPETCKPKVKDYRKDDKDDKDDKGGGGKGSFGSVGGPQIINSNNMITT